MPDEKKDLKVITSDKLIKIISRNTINNGEKYCFILGSGASVKSGIPTGGTIAKKWINELMKSENCKTLDELNTKHLNIKGLNENNFAEHYSEIFDKCYPEGTEKLAYKFFEKEMSNKQPSIGYVFFSEILATTKNNVVITTNFDTLTEDSLFLFTDKRPLVCGHESLANFIDYEIDKPLVAKIHNDLYLKPKNKSSQIKSLCKEWQDALTKILNIYTPVFVGYGGNDPSLMNFLIELYDTNENVKKPYWCYRQSNSEDSPKGKIKNLLEISGGKVSYINGFDEFFMELYFSLDKDPTRTIDLFKKKNQIFYNKVEQDIYEEIISLPPNDVRRQKLFSVLEKNKGPIYYLILLSEKISKNKNNENDAEIEKIIKEAENNKVANEFFYNNLGVLYSEQKNYTEAKNMYKKAIELDSNYFAAYNNLCLLYK